MSYLGVWTTENLVSEYDLCFVFVLTDHCVGGNVRSHGVVYGPLCSYGYGDEPFKTNYGESEYMSLQRGGGYMNIGRGGIRRPMYYYNDAPLAHPYSRYGG